MRLRHISLVARSADRLADFYRTVFGCEDMKPRWRMGGPVVARGTGLPEVEIYAAWLTLPGTDDVFLEIFEIRPEGEGRLPDANTPGLRHLSFDVADIHDAHAAVLAAGGAPLGAITNLGTVEAPVLCVYVRDPEGNILELAQSSRAR